MLNLGHLPKNSAPIDPKMSSTSKSVHLRHSNFSKMSQLSMYRNEKNQSLSKYSLIKEDEKGGPGNYEFFDSLPEAEKKEFLSKENQRIMA